MAKTDNRKFIPHFLEKRLKRLPTKILEEFFMEFKDISALNTQEEVVNEIVLYYEHMYANETFDFKFRSFIRDYLLSARESSYLVKLPNHSEVLQWLTSWFDVPYKTQNFELSTHVNLDLPPKKLEVDKQEIYFPSQVVFLIAKSQSKRVEADGINIVERYPTVEVEFIFREGLEIVEIRGGFQVVRDLLNTALEDESSPINDASSVFVGDAKERVTSPAKPSKFVKFDTLVSALDGDYLFYSAAVGGSKINRISMASEGFRDIKQEGNPVIRAALQEMEPTHDKSKISFQYKGKKYPFIVTNSGGLYFRKYAQEEVVTYVLAKILNPTLSISEAIGHEDVTDNLHSAQTIQTIKNYGKNTSEVTQKIREYIRDFYEGGLINIATLAVFCHESKGNVLLAAIELQSLGEVELVKRYFCPEKHIISSEKVPLCEDCDIKYSQELILTFVYVQPKQQMQIDSKISSVAV